MAKNKLKKFAELASFKHVVQPCIEDLKKSFRYKGKWNKDFFIKSNPIVLELGCGKGEYSVALSKEFPNKNFIGVDIKGSRIWSGAKQAFEDKLTNVGFLRTRIDLICNCFAVNEIDEIWITFPDPQLKRSRSSKRLTHPKFLRMYNSILKSGGRIHLKTDSQFLHGFTLGVISAEKHTLEDATNDLYNSPVKRKHTHIKTFYESLFLSQGMAITYLRFVLDYDDLN